MKKLTFKRAQKEHKKMWEWLAKNPFKGKGDYEFPKDLFAPISNCFACEYGVHNCWNRIFAEKECSYLTDLLYGRSISCPILWPPGRTKIEGVFWEIPCHRSLYGKWIKAEGRRKLRVKLATQIAELPWKEK